MSSSIPPVTDRTIQRPTSAPMRPLVTPAGRRVRPCPVAWPRVAGERRQPALLTVASRLELASWAMPAAAGDADGLHPDQVFLSGFGPRVGPGADDRRALGLGVHVMRRPHDHHGPPLELFRVELVDLEGDPVLGVRDTGPQVLIGERALEGVEDDRPFVQLVQDWQDGGANRAGIAQVPNPLCADQPQAFAFTQALYRARPGAVFRAARIEAHGVVRHGSTP